MSLQKKIQQPENQKPHLDEYGIEVGEKSKGNKNVAQRESQTMYFSKQADIFSTQTDERHRQAGVAFSVLEKTVQKSRDVIDNIPDGKMAKASDVKRILHTAVDQGLEYGYVQGLVQGYISAMIGQFHSLELTEKCIIAKYGLTIEQAEEAINRHYTDQNLEPPVWEHIKPGKVSSNI